MSTKALTRKVDPKNPTAPPSPLSDRKHLSAKLLSSWICGLLIAIHALLLILSARANSATFDEYAHLPAGVAYWKYGWDAFGIYDLSPPLLRLIAAAPVALAGADAPALNGDWNTGPRYRHWNYAELFAVENANRYQFFFVLGRLAMIPISCLGLWIVWKWAGELYGPIAAIAGATIWTVEPNLLAHGSIVGTDAGVSVAILFTCWTWWKFCGNKKITWMIFAALALSTAMLCKFTALILPIILLSIAVARVIERTITWRRALAGFIICLATCWLTINLAYGFRGTFAPIGRYEFQSAPLRSLQQHSPASMPLLLPHDFVEGFDVQTAEIALGVPGFLLGHEFSGARWNYYPVALAVKLPVAEIALIGLAIVSMFFVKPSAAERSVIVAIIITAIFLIGLSKANIGVRYILPVFPLALVLIARIWTARSFFAVARGGLIVMLIVESLFVCPRFLSFINFAGGGPSRGWRIVNDSNFDWGQGLIDLRNWLDAHGRPRIVLAYFGRVNPAVYGIDYSPITAPRGEEFVAVSTYFLDGLEHRLPAPRGHTDFVRLPYAKELRKKTPIGRAGATIYIYRSIDVAEAAREAQGSGR